MSLILLVLLIIALISVGVCFGMANLMVFFIPTIQLVDALIPAAILATVVVIRLGGLIKNFMGSAWEESRSLLYDYDYDYEEEDEDEDDEPPPPVIRIPIKRNNRNRR